ncbi:YokU family protein [Alkalihalobacillus sp. MEB130]|uniref:YokU family protein n=1 Tax=Alkalihalobacillus sp. MEB130 TaxID=2976704 RepID=UPI0028DFD8C0|nr:YokU family protein [Alkalihalobacillus sp. MEB130]MDT8861160.1 YokU family protein [Alkalihalobacillus sp. MEB130]
MKCEWCEQIGAEEIHCTVYWELPDGTRAIEITETPGFECKSCGMEYQKEEIIQEIEDQLLLIDTSKLGKSLSYEQLMNQKRLLKYNYFRF